MSSGLINFSELEISVWKRTKVPNLKFNTISSPKAFWLEYIFPFPGTIFVDA